MKIPSIIRIPDHKRFNFEPRYYDPIKEDIENRTALIKQEMRQTNDDIPRSNLSGAFAKRSRQTRSTNLLQFIILIGLIGIFAGYVFYGNVIFNVVWVLIPVYLYFRFRKNIKRS